MIMTVQQDNQLWGQGAGGMSPPSQQEVSQTSEEQGRGEDAGWR